MKNKESWKRIPMRWPFSYRYVTCVISITFMNLHGNSRTFLHLFPYSDRLQFLSGWVSGDVNCHDEKSSEISSTLFEFSSSDRSEIKATLFFSKNVTFQRDWYESLIDNIMNFIKYGKTNEPNYNNNVDSFKAFSFEANLITLTRSRLVDISYLDEALNFRWTLFLAK